MRTLRERSTGIRQAGKIRLGLLLGAATLSLVGAGEMLSGAAEEKEGRADASPSPVMKVALGLLTSFERGALLRSTLPSASSRAEAGCGAPEALLQPCAQRAVFNRNAPALQTRCAR